MGDVGLLVKKDAICIMLNFNVKIIYGSTKVGHVKLFLQGIFQRLNSFTIVLGNKKAISID